MNIIAVRKLEWDSAHRVLRHESKCATLHGHRYVAEIFVKAPELDACNRVVDFSVLKTIIGQWIDDTWDHTTLINKLDTELIHFCMTEHELRGNRSPYLFDGEPTAENIAKELLLQSIKLLAEHDSALRITAIRVWETPNCWVEVLND